MKLTSDLLDINVTTSSFVLLVKFCLPSSQQDCSVSLLLRMSVSVAFGVLCRIKQDTQDKLSFYKMEQRSKQSGKVQVSYLFDADGRSERWRWRTDREKGKSRQTAGGKRKREERVVTYFPKSCTFFTGVGFHMLRMFFVRSCKLILPIFCRHLLSKIKSTCAECPRAAITYQDSHRKGGTQQRLACRHAVFV